MGNLSILELNAKLLAENAKWEAADSPINQLTDACKLMILGRDEPEILKNPTTTAPATSLKTPSFDPEVDWTNRKGKSYVTPSKKQGSCGSCVSFATVGVLEAMVMIEKGLMLDLSEADQHFCSSHGTTCAGWNDLDAFDQIKKRGVCDDAAFPYATAFPNNDINYYYKNATPYPTCKKVKDRELRAIKITNIHNLGLDQANVKYHLSNVGPVAASMCIYSDFFGYSKGVYHHVTGSYAGHHCIMIVGYSEEEQCWICKNSWGDKWGMSGFFKLAYGECDIDKILKVGVSGVVLPPARKATNKTTLKDKSGFAPSLCQFNGRVYIAWISSKDGKLYVDSSADGKLFDSLVCLKETASGTPSLAVYNNKLFIAWTANESTRPLFIASSADGKTFGTKVPLNQTSVSSPSIASFKGRLYLSWVKSSVDSKINICSSSDGIAFTLPTTLELVSKSSPSMTTLNNLLYIGWADSAKVPVMQLATSSDGITFENKRYFTDTSDSGPALSNDGTIIWTGWGNTGSFCLTFKGMLQSITATNFTDRAVGKPAISPPYVAWTCKDTQMVTVAILG